MSQYHYLNTGITVKPVDQPIYSEMATHIRMVDEAAGPFVAIVQDGKVNPPGENQVHITAEEWPLIVDAVEQMFRHIAAMESDA